jgi:hypothetical protein
LPSALLHHDRRFPQMAARGAMGRDNLDENGGGSGECEAAAGSEEMIVWMIALRKDFCGRHFLNV